MSRLRMALLASSGLVMLAGAVLLTPAEGSAFICSNTDCTSPSTCGYHSGNQCSIIKTAPEDGSIFICSAGLCK